MEDQERTEEEMGLEELLERLQASIGEYEEKVQRGEASSDYLTTTVRVVYEKKDLDELTVAEEIAAEADRR